MASLSPDLSRRPVAFAGGLLLAIGICAALTALAMRALDSAPGEDSAEAGFARDMATHHAQAVEMSFMLRDRSSDEELRALAYDIIVTQSTQRGVFMGWLQEWGLPQASARPRMAWMPGHSQMAAASAAGPVLMHGMASAGELAGLQTATGVEAEVLFLQLMIRHHEGGVLMARALIPLSRRAEVAQMAKSIEDGQRAEIAAMKEMLVRRGARSLPTILG